MSPAWQRVACPGRCAPWGRLGMPEDGLLPYCGASRVSDRPVLLPLARAWRAGGQRDGAG